jgi:hypothetical protein
MIKSSLIKILVSFTEEEMKAFGKFVNSPYFNTSDATAKLFREITKFYPEFSDKNFTKEYLFTKVYGKKYNESLLRKLVSNLIKLTAEFLKIHGKFDSEEFELNLLQEYSRRSLLNHFEKKADNLIAGINREKISNVDSIEFLSKIELLKSDTYYSNENVEKALNTYQSFAGNYLSSTLIKLLLTAVQLEIDNKYTYKLPSNPLSKFVSSINWEKTLAMIEHDSDKALTELYMRMYYIYKNPSDRNNFLSLKEKILKDNTIRDRQLLKTAITNLESYCIINYDSGRDYSMIDHLEEIYEFTLSKNLFERSGKGYMSVNLYRNYLIIFIKKRIDLAENLLNGYLNDIDPEIRKNIKEFTEMFIFFKKKAFEKALFHLSNIELIHFTFKYDIKSYLIKIHFELGNFEQVFSAIDSYKHFLNDQKKSERFTSEIKEFLSCILKLSGAVSNKNRGELEHLKYKIEKHEFAYERIWLLEKIEQHMKI